MAITDNPKLSKRYEQLTRHQLWQQRLSGHLFNPTKNPLIRVAADSFNDPDLSTGLIVDTYSTKGFENCTVKILVQKMEKDDPLNPNPNVARRVWRVKVRDTISKPYGTLAAAQFDAKRLHDRLVEKVRKSEENLDGWGMF